MITEDYVSFEIAKLLKEKGFKHWCYKCYGDAVYHNGTPISFDEECELKSAGLEDEIEYVEGGCLYDFGCNNSKEDTKVWAAPTLQMAMKWLRENHNLHIEARITNHSLSNSFDIPKYYWVVFNTKSVKWADESTVYKSMDFDSYEECCDAAVKHCLEHLI